MVKRAIGRPDEIIAVDEGGRRYWLGGENLTLAETVAEHTKESLEAWKAEICA